MNWIKRKLRSWLYNDQDLEVNMIQKSGTISSARRIDSTGFNLRVYKASGGTVIETNVYDSNKDRHHNGLYVITDDKDLGQELNKIITMENLRV